MNIEELAALAARLRLIDNEMESLSRQDTSQSQQIFAAMELSRERTSIRQRLVADST